ncbi:hypothetical protein Tco_0437641, partial [Tanacetum coccineum]
MESDLMTIDEGQINWVEQTTDEELNHALMAFTVNNEDLNEPYTTYSPLNESKDTMRDN